MRVAYKGLSGLVVFFVVTGCASVSPYRANPNWNEKKGSIHTIEVIPDKIEVFRIIAGGVQEKIDDWSSDAKKNVVAALMKELQDKHGFVAKPFPEETLSKEAASNLKETRALFEAVNTSIVTHTYGPGSEQFPEKITQFDYSLGKEVKDLNTENADAILMVWSVSFVWTVLGKKMTFMSVALVDPDTGSILWYRYLQVGGQDAIPLPGIPGEYTYDLRKAERAAGMVKTVLTDFPGLPGDHGNVR